MKKNKLWSLLKEVIVITLIVVFIRGFVLIPIHVSGNSMKETLHQGDTLIMEKFSKIKRFDVVVFQQGDGSFLIKRVIGLPGEHIAVKNDTLYINGKVMKEPFLQNEKKKDHAKIPYTANFTLEDLTKEKQLKKNHYFLMGDNRRMSKDSRDFGPVKGDEIIGKARFVYAPLKHWQKL